jgi:hypothetical protein
MRALAHPLSYEFRTGLVCLISTWWMLLIKFTHDRQWEDEMVNEAHSWRRGIISRTIVRPGHGSFWHYGSTSSPTQYLLPHCTHVLIYGH